MNGNELYHSGTKGMKWYRRLYQNPDGTYTELGKMRRRVGPYAKRALTQNIKQGKDKPPISPAEKAIKETKNIGDSAKSIAERRLRNKNADARSKYNEELQKEIKVMSDEELRKRINRMNLETQYSKAMYDKNFKEGRSKAADIIDTMGDVIGVTGGLVGIGVALRYIIKGD